MNYKLRYELAVGLVFFIAVGILGYYTIIMSKDFLNSKEFYLVTVKLSNSGGLKEKDKVKVNGVFAGSVKDIKLKDNIVILKLKMFGKFTLYKNYSIRVVSTSLIAGKEVQIDPGLSVDVKTGKIYPALTSMSDLSGSVDDPIKTISALLEENKQNIYNTIRNVKEITEKINNGKGTIGKLINDDGVYSKTDGLLKEVGETLEDAREQAPITSFIRAALTAF